MTDIREVRDPEVDYVEARQVAALQDELDQLRLDVAELRASRRRLVLAAEADRRVLERDLHDRVQQQLVALAVNLQLAGKSANADPAAAEALLRELAHDVQQTLEDTAELAQRIYPPLLEAGGLAAALRSAALSAGVRVSLEVETEASYPLEVARAVYWCCLEVLDDARPGALVRVIVRDGHGAVSFDVVADGSIAQAGLERLRDRVEALGGQLTSRSEPGGETRVSGSLPMSE